MSCKSRNITASRSSGDSFCRASCTIFWACWLCTRSSGLADWSGNCSPTVRPSSCPPGVATPGGQEDGLTVGEQLPDQSASPEERVQSQQAQKMVHEALQKLSPELREAVILRDLQDMDYKDIAKVLNVPEGTVKSRINRGRTELARLLQRSYRQVS